MPGHLICRQMRAADGDCSYAAELASCAIACADRGRFRASQRNSGAFSNRMTLALILVAGIEASCCARRRTVLG